MTKTTKHTNNEQEVLVKVDGLSKKFCIDLKTSLWYGVKDLLRGIQGNKLERELRPKEFWAIKDISFELRRGECLGLIGHNGAGKSTLLKILNGLINPDAGKVTIKGRVGALIELGAGFNPILTGRENIYNNGAVLGFSRKEIDIKLEEIIDFAELKPFIDMPVQNYSSGMKVRLGFAVASQMEPDILIIDEVLAVGDIGFRIKCYNKIQQLIDRTAVIFVSHSMPDVVRIANKMIVMNHGIDIYSSTNLHEGINVYYDLFENLGKKANDVILGLKLNTVSIFQDGIESLQIQYDKPVEFEMYFKADVFVEKIAFTVAFSDMNLKWVAFSQSNIINIEDMEDNRINFKLPRLPLTTGKFNIGFEFYDVSNSIEITSTEKLNVVFRSENFVQIKVHNTKSLRQIPILLEMNVL